MKLHFPSVRDERFSELDILNAILSKWVAFKHNRIDFKNADNGKSSGLKISKYSITSFPSSEYLCSFKDCLNSNI